MKIPIAIFLFFFYGVLFANDYRWNLVNALVRNDFTTVENIINQNINIVPAVERRLIMNLAITYSRGYTTLRTLDLLQSFNVHPVAFDLYTAINMNQPDTVVRFIMNTPVAANGEILLLAMERQRFDLAKEFISAGADVNFQFPLSRFDTDGMTALLYASRFNNFELVQMLLDHGANINARNSDGSTALAIAQMNGNTQISDFLIERGAVQNIPAPVQSQQPLTGGIASFLNNQTVEFQPGTYRLSGGNRDLTFTGNANSGRISFLRDNRLFNGSYHAHGGNLTMMMDGRLFVYRIDSNMSFSGNGETWVRIGN